MRPRTICRRLAAPCAVLALCAGPICSGAKVSRASSNIRYFVGTVAAAQDPPSQTPGDPASTPQIATGTPGRVHKVKVWTNEELISTRTPADLYIFQKEAQTAADQEAAYANLVSCFAPPQAQGDADETQKEIDATLQEIRDSEDAVNQSRRALRSAPESLKLRNQMELSQRNAELNHAREKLWKLQEHLQEVQKSSATPAAPDTTNPDAGPAPGPSQNPAPAEPTPDEAK